VDPIEPLNETNAEAPASTVHATKRKGFPINLLQPEGGPIAIEKAEHLNRRCALVQSLGVERGIAEHKVILDKRRRLIGLKELHRRESDSRR
jgi:hypothetical protein